MNDPIFVSGLRKSGTSMVKNLLDGHPDLFTYPPNELHFFRYSEHDSVVKDKQGRANSPADLCDQLAGIDFVQRMAEESSDDYRPQIDIDRFNELVANHQPTEYPEVYKALFESMARAASHFEGNFEDCRPTSKTVLETEFFSELREWFPDLKFVYVLRSPYGHFASARNSMRLQSGTGEGSEMGILSDPYPFVGSELRRMQLSYYFAEKFARLHPEQFYVLIYDEILADPEPTLRDLAAFLGIDYHESLTNPTICGEPWGGNSWYVEEFEGIDPSPLNHWRDDIGDGELKMINALFKDFFEAYGFEVIEPDSTVMRPFHLSERPWTYVANRFAVYWQKHGSA